MSDDSNILFQKATSSDVDAIVAMLANDKLGAKRENYITPLPQSYLDAFNKIEHDPCAFLVVGKVESRVVAVAQMNILTYLIYQGGCRAQIEGVRVDESCRGQGVGKKIFEYLIQLAEQHHCHVVQLTTDHRRPDAFNFYEALGFKQTHAGFKLFLPM